MGGDGAGDAVAAVRSPPPLLFFSLFSALSFYKLSFSTPKAHRKINSLPCVFLKKYCDEKKGDKKTRKEKTTFS